MVLAPAIIVALLLLATRGARADRLAHTVMDPAVTEHARVMPDEGRRVFRYETFGDEAFWGDTLKLHQAIAGSKLGGVGPGVSPKKRRSASV